MKSSANHGSPQCCRGMTCPASSALIPRSLQRPSASYSWQVHRCELQRRFHRIEASAKFPAWPKAYLYEGSQIRQTSAALLQLFLSAETTLRQRHPCAFGSKSGLEHPCASCMFVVGRGPQCRHVTDKFGTAERGNTWHTEHSEEASAITRRNSRQQAQMVSRTA